MEGIFQTMLFFLGLKLLLGQQSKDKKMGRGHRGKRKHNKQEADDQRTVKEIIESKPKKPFESLKLPPPRDAQEANDENESGE